MHTDRVDLIFLLVVAVVGFGGAGWLLIQTKKLQQRRRLARLSHNLADKHLEYNESCDDTLGDGITDEQQQLTEPEHLPGHRQPCGEEDTRVERRCIDLESILKPRPLDVIRREIEEKGRARFAQSSQNGENKT
jgi:hypothetical protein